MAVAARKKPLPVVQLTITLDDVEPKVARCVAVPYRIRLDALHLVFQAAMGWTNSHLYMIAARSISWGEPDPDVDFGDLLPAGRTRLCDLVADTGAKSFKYVYDFGDDWRHTVKIGRVIEMAPEIADPLLLGATGRCPQEDCGGPWGYQEMLVALADSNHARHAESVENLGADYDAAAVDEARLAEAVVSLSKPRSKRRPVMRIWQRA